MLDACGEVDTLSTTNPLVLPAELGGTGTALVTSVGGQVMLVTLSDSTQPGFPDRQALPDGIGSVLLALAPMLKKIQSVEVPVL